MANILESKSRLKQIIYTNKDKFTKEIDAISEKKQKEIMAI